jgi:two-component system nitrogen regulation response regulator NtrX
MKILIVDDNIDFASTLADIVESFGFQSNMLHTPGEAINYLDSHHRNIGVVLLDIEFGPDEELDGIDLLAHFRKSYPEIPVIMISGKGTIETAVKATKLGAVNFVEKSIVSRDKIKEVLDAAIKKFHTKNESKDIQKFLFSQGIIGISKSIMEIGDNIIRYGRTDLNVLITGETGTGKKLVAQAIHAASRRARYPFVTVDIPNIPRELFQSELFGHIKGSFSGATESKKGLFHQANKGAIFLDEIGDMPIDIQSNLFIPIEEKVVRRVGSVQSEEVDLRFISATDRDLVAAMKKGEFREQLYHRLRECEIHIPPLHERNEDIPHIIDYYVSKHNLEFDEEKMLSPAAREFMQEQIFPGNVRELASILRVVLQTSQKEQVEVNDLHRLINNKKTSVSFSDTNLISTNRTLKEDIQEVDKKKIESTLANCRGNVTKSAAKLGVSRETLHNKIRRYGIDIQQYRKKRN